MQAAVSNRASMQWMNLRGSSLVRMDTGESMIPRPHRSLPCVASGAVQRGFFSREGRVLGPTIRIAQLRPV